MPQTTHEDVIQMLMAAVEDEHAALIQYLRHAYMMGEGELACEIEGIAREEMRHLWILSRWIVRLGEQPTTQRGFTDLSGAAAPEWMQRDVAAEERAIAMYEGYLTRVADPDLQADIEHILADERRHHGDFAHFVDKTTLALQQTPAPAEPTGEPVPAMAIGDKEALSWGVNHEYAAILQYLVHSFLTMEKDEEISSQLMTQAINEMQHMGWFGEELVGGGEAMPLTHHPLTLPADPRRCWKPTSSSRTRPPPSLRPVHRAMVDPSAGVIDDARARSCTTRVSRAVAQTTQAGHVACHRPPPKYGPSARSNVSRDW